MRRLTVRVLLLMATVAVSACDDEFDSSGATPTPAVSTATATPPVQFDVSGESPPDTLRPGTLSFFATYVYDMQAHMLLTVEVTEIEQNTAERPATFAGWTEDGRLRFSGSAGAYEVRLDGGVTAVAQLVPTPTPDPESLTSSTDGAWRASRTGAEYIVTSADDSAQYRLVGTNVNLDWAPRGRLAAFTTGPFHGGDLHLFDPDGGTLHNLAGSGDFVLDWSWHPEGTRIAANFLGNSGQGIAIFDAARGSVELAVPSNGGGELAPLAWSNDGRYLAFRFRGGRDFGCGEGGTEPPYVAPALERIR